MADTRENETLITLSQSEDIHVDENRTSGSTGQVLLSRLLSPTIISIILGTRKKPFFPLALVVVPAQADPLEFKVV